MEMLSPYRGGQPVLMTPIIVIRPHRQSTPTVTLSVHSGPTPQGCVARGPWHTRAGTAGRPPPTCRIPLALRATRRQSAPPTGCRRVRSGGHGAAARSLASGVGAAVGPGATRRRSTPHRQMRAAAQRGRMMSSLGGPRVARYDSERRPPGGSGAIATKRAERAAAPRLHPRRGPAGVPPAP